MSIAPHALPARSVATVDDCREALRLIYGLLADFDRKLTVVVDAIVEIRDDARRRDAQLAAIAEKLPAA